MKVVALNKIDSAISYIKNKKVQFEVNPLDVGIAEIQFNLQNKLERLIPEHGDFAPVAEKFISKSPDLNVSEIKVLCCFLDKEVPKKDQRKMEIHITDKAGVNSYCFVMTQGKKDTMLDFINSKHFFEACKKTVLYVHENVEKV